MGLWRRDVRSQGRKKSKVLYCYHGSVYIFLWPQEVTSLSKNFPLVTQSACMCYLAALQNHIVSENFIAVYAVLLQFFSYLRLLIPQSVPDQGQNISIHKLSCALCSVSHLFSHLHQLTQEQTHFNNHSWLLSLQMTLLADSFEEQTTCLWTVRTLLFAGSSVDILQADENKQHFLFVYYHKAAESK